MRERTIQIATLALLLLGQPVAACETAAGEPGEALLHTRRPVQGDEVRLVSGFSLRRHPLLMVTKLHTGIDWTAPIGSPVVAAAGGRVVFAGVNGEYGNTVFIDHGAGWQTIYAHLSGFEVRENDCVAALTLIAKSGATGLTAGPVLHFEVQRSGQPIDPLRLPFKEPGQAK